MGYYKYITLLLIFSFFSSAILMAHPLPLKDTCNEPAKISREKAISIAKSKDYYPDANPEITPEVQFDPCYRRWIVRGIRYTHSNKGDCKNTNGCTVEERSLIIIHADTGKILFKEKTTKVYHNYE